MKRLVVEVAGIGQATSIVLAKYGFETIRDLASSNIKSLSIVPGFADARSALTIRRAEDLLREEAVLSAKKINDIAVSKKEVASKVSKKAKKIAKKGKNKSKDNTDKAALMAKKLTKAAAKLKKKKGLKEKAGSKAADKKKKTKKNKKK
ncbi:MAG: helix-hairpin-helix domain-containing protein [Cycloclasticus sp.]